MKKPKGVEEAEWMEVEIELLKDRTATLEIRQKIIIDALKKYQVPKKGLTKT